MIELDVVKRSITLLVDEAEIVRRLAELGTPEARLEIPATGYRRLYQTTVTQADVGCDFDFMVPVANRSAPIIKEY
jgi:dihydroxy-acid dehydratase